MGELEIEENLLAESGSEKEASEKISIAALSEIISVKDEAILDSPDEYESYDFKNPEQSSNEDQSDDDVEVHDVIDAEWKEYDEEVKSPKSKKPRKICQKKQPENQ